MFEQFASQIRPYEGSISFRLSDHGLFNETPEPITIDRYKIEDAEFLLQREPNLMLVFQHITPKYGTRVSRLDMNKVPKVNQHRIVFTWSPKEIRVYMGIDGRDPVQGDYQRIA